jgi:hypothetical protein
MNIKELLLEGCRISMPYKNEPEQWVGETKIYIFSGGFGCEPKLIVEGDYCNGYRKEFELNQLDDAIEYFNENAFNKENLWYKMNQVMCDLASKDNNIDLEDPDDYKAVMEARELLLINTDNTEEKLRTKARKKGFIKGAVFAPCDYELNKPQIEIEDLSKILYNKDADALYYEGYAIYQEGCWGEILYMTRH